MEQYGIPKLDDDVSDDEKLPIDDDDVENENPAPKVKSGFKTGGY